MSKKATLKSITAGHASNTQLDFNFDALNDKFENTLSLDGSTPNAMGADLDMNSKAVLNASSVATTELVHKGVILTDPSILTGVAEQEYSTVALLQASTEASRGVGAIWEAGGFRYIEVASGGDITTAGSVELDVIDDSNVAAYGADVTGATDGAAEFQLALDNTGLNSFRHAFVGGVLRVDSTIALGNDRALSARTQGLTQKSRMYASGNFPIIERASGYQSRTIIDGMMFHGQTDGDYSGTLNSNTSPLVNLEEGGAYFEMNRAMFNRGAIGLRHGAALNLTRIRDTKFNTMSDKGAHLVGPRNILFDGCGFENCGWGVYAEPSLAVANVGEDTMGANTVILRTPYTENADFFLDCATPMITGGFLSNTDIWIGKNAVNPIVKENTHLIGSQVLIPPKFIQDVSAYGYNMINEKTQTNFSVPPLPVFSDISGTGYVVGDGLDYFVVTQIKPNNSYIYDPIGVEFKRDAVVVSDDDGYLIQSNNNADDNGGRVDLAMTTYGVIENTGAAMSVNVTGAAATPKQHDVFIQSLIKNGTFPSGSTTNWFETGTTTQAVDGDYFHISSASNSNLLSYNKILHFPESTETLLVASRVKNGSTGTIAVDGLRCGKWLNFFDNGDGTFDDLWLQYVYVKGDLTRAKTAIQIYRFSGETGYDMRIKWIAALPLVADGEEKVYRGVFTWDPASLATGASATMDIMSDGSTSNDLKLANVGDYVRVIPPYDMEGLSANGYVNATGGVRVRLRNDTGGAVDLASGVWRWELIKQ